MYPRDFAVGPRQFSGKSTLSAADVHENASVAHASENRIVLLDVGDHAVQWRLGDRFAVSVGASRTIEGTYIPWVPFHLALLPSFHRRDRLIVVAALEVGGLEGRVRVFKDSHADWFLAARYASLPVGSLELKLLELMAVLSLFNRLPKRRALVGVQAPTSACAGERRSGMPRALAEADTLAVEIEQLVLGWESQSERRRRA
jgi:hypothetical protein